jgi:hypothetical protein
MRNGVNKTWKLSSKKSLYTFGTSPLANMNSIDFNLQGIQGVFEYSNNEWNFTSLDIEKSAKEPNSNSMIISSEGLIEFNDCTLQCNTAIKQFNIFEDVEKFANQSSLNGLKKQYQIFIVKQAGRVIETKILPLNKAFRPLNYSKKIAYIYSPEWNRINLGNLEISQKTISMDDSSILAQFTTSQIVDDDARLGSLIMLGFAALVLTIAIFLPKDKISAISKDNVQSSQQFFAKTEMKPKKKKPAASPTAQPSQKIVISEPAPGTKTNSTAPSNSGKMASMMKAFSGGRISQLIGKVSAQGSKSANVKFASGIKAGSGPSGSALSSLGSIEQSGQDWGTAGKGKGVTISTVGKGGGRKASGMGGLSAGSTGNKAVGLLEEEGEITGGLDREVIAQYIKSQLGQILYCYERQLSANPDLFGKVAVKFVIGPNGRIEQQNIGDSTLKNSNVEGCILNKISSWKFPNPQGGTRVYVTYPFLFKSTN